MATPSLPRKTSKSRSRPVRFRVGRSQVRQRTSIAVRRPLCLEPSTTADAQAVEGIGWKDLPLGVGIEGVAAQRITALDAAIAAQRVIHGAAPAFARVDADLSDYVQEPAIATEGHDIVAIEGQIADLVADRRKLFFQGAGAQREHLARFEHAAQSGDHGGFGLAVEIAADFAAVQRGARLRGDFERFVRGRALDVFAEPKRRGCFGRAGGAAFTGGAARFTASTAGAAITRGGASDVPGAFVESAPTVGPPRHRIHGNSARAAVAAVTAVATVVDVGDA